MKEILIKLREYCLELEMKAQDNTDALIHLSEASYHLALFQANVELAEQELKEW